MIVTDLKATRVNHTVDHEVNLKAGLTAEATEIPIAGVAVIPIVGVKVIPTAGLTVNHIAEAIVDLNQDCALMNHKKNDEFIDHYYEMKDTVNGYRICKFLGEGRYGIVYLAEDDKKEKYVIKQLKREMLLPAREKTIYEEDILRKLCYPYFPKFISRFIDNTREGYILQYMEGKVMEDLLYDAPYLFTKDEIYKICWQLLELVELLHDNNIVHRDIRLPNVIQKENHDLALIDFGLARYLDNDRYTKEMDFWYIGDFLIHLYYASYVDTGQKDKPWFEELHLTGTEALFLKRLMGIEKSFQTIDEIRTHLSDI